MIFLSFQDIIGDISSKIFPSFEAVLVQLVATSVLLFVVIKFLYKPAKELIAKRDNYINSQISEADEKLKKAETTLQEAQNFRSENLKESNKILKDSRDEAKKEKQMIIESARAEANQIKEKALKDIELEKKKARKEIKKEIVELSMDISKSILQRELNEEDEDSSFSELINEVNRDE